MIVRVPSRMPAHPHPAIALPMIDMTNDIDVVTCLLFVLSVYYCFAVHQLSALICSIVCQCYLLPFSDGEA